MKAEVEREMAAGRTVAAEARQRGRRLAERLLQRNCEGWQTFPKEVDVVLDAAGFRSQVRRYS